MKKMITAAVVVLAAGCGEGFDAVSGEVDPAEVPPVVTAAEADAEPDPAEAPGTTRVPAATEPPATTGPPATTAPLGAYNNPATWSEPFGNDDVRIEITGLSWQTDTSAYNYFDEELCEEYDWETMGGCEVIEGKGVLVLAYDATRLAGEPGAFFWNHGLITADGRVIDGSELHCSGAEMVELAPGGTARHETCFVVDVDQIGPEAQVGLAEGWWADRYWVIVPVTG